MRDFSVYLGKVIDVKTKTGNMWTGELRAIVNGPRGVELCVRTVQGGEVFIRAHDVKEVTRHREREARAVQKTLKPWRPMAGRLPRRT